jgi:hypothetical protein
LKVWDSEYKLGVFSSMNPQKIGLLPNARGRLAVTSKVIMNPLTRMLNGLKIASDVTYRLQEVSLAQS